MILDLFSGVGGFTLGAVRAGISVGLSVDWDDDLTAAHVHNFPKIPLLKQDLRELGPSQLLEHANLAGATLEGIVGGPPCQGFSNMGRRDESDPRNRLVGRFFETVSALHPAYFIFENVPGILTNRFRPILDASIELVSARYTILGPMVLNAKDFGAPTDRPRVVVLGVEHPTSPLEEAALPAARTQTTVSQAFSGLPEPESGNGSKPCHAWQRVLRSKAQSAYAKRMSEPPPCPTGNLIQEAHAAGRVSGFQVTNHSPAVAKRFAKVQPGATDPISKFPRLHPKRQAPTIRAGTGRDRGCYQAVRPIHPATPRVITVREAARLQGFPDWFVFHRTKWHSFRMIGNSVTPAMSQALLEFCSKRIR